MSIASFLSGAVGPLVVKALNYVGFAAVTFTGAQAVVNGLIENAQGNWSTLPLAALQMASLGGFPEALGMMLGAVVVKLTLWIGASSSKLIFTGRAA